jgi:hypothetical protein
MARDRKIALKFRVKQEFEVIVYYEQGVNADTGNEAEQYIKEDVLELAFNEEGIVVRTSEETDNSNPYIALVTTDEPELELIYTINQLPKEIEQQLREQGIMND